MMPGWLAMNLWCSWTGLVRVITPNHNLPYGKYNVDSHGNQGAAGAPMVMSMHWDRFALGDLIVMAVVGAGLTWGAALFRCL